MKKWYIHIVILVVNGQASVHKSECTSQIANNIIRLSIWHKQAVWKALHELHLIVYSIVNTNSNTIVCPKAKHARS